MAMTAKELAKKIGVSPSAVSLALNGKPGISEKNRQTILTAANAYGLKRASRKAQTPNVLELVCFKKHGMVFGETPFFSAVIEGVTTQAAHSGYTISVSYIYGDHDPAADVAALRASPSAGIILLATEMTDCDLQLFADLEKPMVVLDSYFACFNFNCVVINNQQGAYQATKHILANGHRRIGHLASSVKINNFVERERGFLAACSEHADCTSVTVHVGSTQESAYLDMMAYLQTEPELPTAFFADNDIIAVSCIRALKDCHYHIPQDVSIVGFDDMPLAFVTSPKLTTVHVCKEELGQYAVEKLLKAIENPDRPRLTTMVNTTITKRESVRDLNA